MIKLYHGDCLEIMKDIPDKSIDMVLCDLPYGVTAAKWDKIIPIDKLWVQYERIVKDNAAICLFGNEPFSSHLRLSNIKHYKYDWIWDKKIPSGMSYCRYQPMRQTENISVFCYSGKTNYYPQMIKREKPIKAGGMGNSVSAATQGYKPLKKTYDYKNPINIIAYQKIRQGSVHPTQKPVALLEYLIKTYTTVGGACAR